MDNTLNILLISANQLIKPYPVYPLGVAYITTYLKEHLPQSNIKLFDFNLSNIDELKAELKKFQPKYIGVSIRNIDGVNSYDPHNFIGGYKKILEVIHGECDFQHTTIIGGAGFSIFPKTMFEILKPDYAVSGEGEVALYKLINALENNISPENIEGLVYYKEDRICINHTRSLFTSPNLRFDNSLADYYWINSGMLNIQTKRGCPFKCIYCTYPIIEGTNVRVMDVDKVVKSLKEIYLDRKIDYVFFTDSVFNMMGDYNYQLAEKIIESGINIHWGAYFFPKGMDEEMLKLFKRSGLVHIEFGTESICDKTLENYGKHFTVDDIFEQSELCRKLNIDYAHFLILAGYGETDETIDITFDNSRKIKRTVFFPFVGMRIYPGTRLHDIAIAEGVVSMDDDLIEPKYYISSKVNIDTLKERAGKTGRRWVFPDEDTSAITSRMRTARNKKGPLWEYLIN